MYIHISIYAYPISLHEHEIIINMSSCPNNPIHPILIVYLIVCLRWIQLYVTHSHMCIHTINPLPASSSLKTNSGIHRYIHLHPSRPTGKQSYGVLTDPPFRPWYNKATRCISVRGGSTLSTVYSSCHLPLIQQISTSGYLLLEPPPRKWKLLFSPLISSGKIQDELLLFLIFFPFFCWFFVLRPSLLIFSSIIINVKAEDADAPLAKLHSPFLPSPARCI